MKRKTITMAAAFVAFRGTCKTCAHWEPNDEKSAGFCLRYPPYVIVDEQGVSTTWPAIGPDERCGEHKGSN